MNFEEVTGLPKNGNYTLMKTIYDRPRKGLDGKYGDDLLTVIYKNNDDNSLVKVEIDKPLIEAYMVNDDVPIAKPELHISRKKVHKIDLEYNRRARDCAKLIGPEALQHYYNCIKNRNSVQAEAFMKSKYFFSTDVDIQDFYRIKSLEYFGQKDVHITKGFLDIETDILNHDFDLENACGDAPVNAVTVVDGTNKCSYTLLLRDDENPQVQELEDDINGFIKELEDEFGNNPRFKGFKYGIKFFDDEAVLLTELFALLHALKLDYILIWNMRFDMRYLMQRMYGLGLDPHEVMTDPTFKSDTCYFHLDTNPQTADKYITRSDECVIAMYSQIMDQMLLYAQVRKAKSIPSYKLDAIGQKETGEGKISYSDIGNIATFPKRNYRKFVKYNIKDVLVQYAIEDEVNDVDFLFQKSYESGTRQSKAFKETVYNRNLGYIYFKKQGRILGTNQNNMHYGEDEGKKEKFEGAVVGNPKLNKRTGIKILGIPSNSIIDDLQDQDVESMYPTVIMSCNIDATTQIGRLIMNKDNITDRELIDDMNKYDRGGRFVDDLQVREPLLFMHRWHNLPSPDELIRGFGEANPQHTKKKLFKNKNVKVKKLFKNR